MKPSEYLQARYEQALPKRVNALGVQAIANHCGLNVVEVIAELVEAQTEGRLRGGFPIEVVAGMWQWRVKAS